MSQCAALFRVLARQRASRCRLPLRRWAAFTGPMCTGASPKKSAYRALASIGLCVLRNESMLPSGDSAGSGFRFSGSIGKRTGEMMRCSNARANCLIFFFFCFLFSGGCTRQLRKASRASCRLACLRPQSTTKTQQSSARAVEADLRTRPGRSSGTVLWASDHRGHRAALSARRDLH